VPASSDSFQTAVFAGGCFWSVELVFEHVNGVFGVTTGYSGGLEETASYDLVAIRQTTDHAEVVEVTFDPAVVSYGDLLRIFFSVAHHPTQIDQQLPDVGREYRSHIYYNNESQRQVAEAYIDQLNASGALEKPIATRVDARQAVYRAEDQHQDFAAKNTNSSYVLIYSFPKVAKLAGVLPALFRPNQSG
jgi:peptide-methionine (S)-S-oxide reductase